ncbi:MAG: hypothetical protein NDJ75_11840 [Thermoanaerobaculia bacterium]|nr:hypothetical protein [Thermoanaerobaculia bacterium]
MRSRSLGTLSGLLAALVVSIGCAAGPRPCPPPAPPPPPPPPPPPTFVGCEATATILYWVEAGQPKAKVVGNLPYASEEKNVFLDASVLSPGQSQICWLFVPTDPSSTAQLQWVHIKDFSAPIFAGNGQFDPNAIRENRQTFAQAPTYQSIEFPLGSGQFIDGARVSYNVWIKLQGGAAPFLADPDVIIKKPGG